MPFTERTVALGGARVKALDLGGEGKAIVLLDADASSPTKLMTLLAEKARVLALPKSSASPAEIVAGLAALGIEKFTPVGHGESAKLALKLAADPAIRSAVILAPPPLAGEDASLAGITVPVLALFGTRDKEAPPTAGGRYRTSLKDCHLVFVYDASHALAEDRPDAVAEMVGDFVEHEDKFLVTHASGVINP